MKANKYECICIGYINDSDFRSIDDMVYAFNCSSKEEIEEYQSECPTKYNIFEKQIELEEMLREHYIRK